MGKDIGWKGFLSDDERYADVINGIGCKGEQVVKKEDLQELDTQTGSATALLIFFETLTHILIQNNQTGGFR